ncbi:MazG-like nucleotide pyrophosphohydrolase family protein [Cytobacillus oceanisediminis]|jgi:NTP pyrophosphatase (non-canonical NTP hydrolase)|uniref:MazG-like nucleotide pyrophosphohydrolase family protein n=1 Tax=Cytobacillus oceanisediminis TaxID=665099 RepID=A0A2V3A5K2_9BACI|nr:MazG nucleotide pyrophosphohydrolase domain-containing protein [Cytobacillus oceanisediminis]PWW28866.1 MazG-like nucleotide pyrophosphohydrolase family protein [Cytobacillus oceanisediminis]
MKELQNFMRDYQKKMGWEISEENYAESRDSLLNNYMLLTTEVAEVAEELRKAFNLVREYTKEGMDEEQAFALAKDQVKEDIGKELADCLAYLIKFYNFFGIEIDESFYRKMEEVKIRKNKDTSLIEK